MSIRDESFFSGSKLNIWQIVIILYMYSHQTATVKNLRHECNISSPNAITNWRNYVRDIYAEYFLRHPSQIGGPGHTVEIDESAFVRRKYNRGHQVNTQWVFGGIDVNTRRFFGSRGEERRGDFASSASGACITWDHGYIRFVEGIFNSRTYWI